MLNWVTMGTVVETADHNPVVYAHSILNDAHVAFCCPQRYRPSLHDVLISGQPKGYYHPIFMDRTV